MTCEHEAWLNLTTEEVIDPALPICDAHHHLWDEDDIRERYMLDEFLQDVSGGHNIVDTVFVDCTSQYRNYGPLEMRPVGETEFVTSIVSRRPYVAAGIVGFADLTMGAAVERVLEAHIEVGGDRFSGIRHSCAWHKDPAVMPFTKAEGIMMNAKFREGFACLQKYDLSFDAWQYQTQLSELVDLVRSFPDTRVVVNHAGGLIGIGEYAGKQKEVFQDWKQRMLELAAYPNVFMKLGGLGMSRCGFGWHEFTKPPTSIQLAEAISPYCLTCIEIFEPDRCMFESNFPVDKLSYSYTILWNAFKRISEGFSFGERAKLFHDTAAKVYRLRAVEE